MLYRFSATDKFSSIKFPESSQIISQPTLIGKVFKGLLTLILVYFINISAGLLVRYIYITTLTLVALLGGEKVSRNIGWLHRYTEMTQSR